MCAGLEGLGVHAHAVDVRQDVPPGRILDEAHVAKDA